MEKLQELSQSELQELLENPERVDAMALESDEIQNIQLEREMALAANRSLAEQNLARRPYLENQKEALVDRYLQLETVQEKYREHCAQRDGVMGQVSPEAFFTKLQSESSKTEEESESLADEFLDGSLPLDSFLDRFLALRTLAHKRRVQIEKIQEILRQRSENTASSTPAAGPKQDSSTSTQPSPWSQPTSNHISSSNPPPPAPPAATAAPGLPYAPYPVSPPNPPPPVPAAAASNAPYPNPGSSFTPAGGYTGPLRPAFGPPPAAPASSCPYPTQPAFTGPHPGSAFGQYTPRHPHPPSSSGPAPYPASYSYGGYSYPTGPAFANSTQSPPGRPIYRPGYGVPQPYS